MLFKSDFEQEDPKFWKSSKLTFEDKGTVTKRGRSRKYAVSSRRSSLLLGYIKWQTFSYIFFPLNTFLDRDELREIADFCDKRTSEQLEAARQRLAEKKLKYIQTRHIPGPVPKALKLRLERETVAET